MVKMLKRKDLIVFYLPTHWNHLDSPSPLFEWAWLDQEKVSLFFSQDVRLNMFKKFLTKGFIGLVWYKGGEWVSYAWMSPPESFGPPHLPRGIQRLPVYWIFYCRTKEIYQGHGLYKASLRLLAHWARGRDPEAKVYIDTEPKNIASRHAIKDVGFVPKGIITTWTLRIPRYSFVIWGRWDQNAPHPKV